MCRFIAATFIRAGLKTLARPVRRNSHDVKEQSGNKRKAPRIARDDPIAPRHRGRGNKQVVSPHRLSGRRQCRRDLRMFSRDGHVDRQHRKPSEQPFDERRSPRTDRPRRRPVLAVQEFLP